MKPLPKISIVIPSYNKVEYIQETLESIVSQKYPHLEVIIQDGGSTDGSLKIIQQYAQRYDWINYESKRDKGQADAINTGFKKATGEILTYINADDVYEKGALKRVGKNFAENPDTFWLAGRGRVIDETGHEIAKPFTWYKNLFLYFNFYSSLLILNYLMQPSVFLSRRAYKKYGPFFGGKYVVEYDMWLKLGKQKMPLVLNRTLSYFRLGGGVFPRLFLKKSLKKSIEGLKNTLRTPQFFSFTDCTIWGE